ncbi:probable bifunctional methylthioribulose-1-phosphate dehydratase/enolase-phosphatase E1 1 isoform X1 [Asparagus officinalis]|uniref:probable bifunctional methylthioribulose-1-phosphate dehydratase/enolase-phosphatase E1 1 isoform X1 n=1 Tax=Asparagus officinalis TaxID=4686 RepID=UPI00098DE6B4|nr:probable bifunctional methylthioribulose-1-phosphate dehydratase/enolase-phosphatase E1 1 isoform X1 [Asparagus officinalis]
MVHDDAIPKPQQLVVMSPSGVQKERMMLKDMHVLSGAGVVLSALEKKPYPIKSPKCTDRAPLFMKAERYHYLFDAAIKFHQLGIHWTSPGHGPASNVRVHRGREMHLNGSVMASSLNGNYIAEPPRGTLQQCIVLDIEGTTTPISFVTDVLFPYARDNVRKHLMATYDTKETKEDIELLRAQVKDDLEQGVVGSVAIPPDDAGEEKVIDSLVTNVEAMIKADRKITALKQLQGHIWRTGFESNELQGAVFEDVPEALEKWHANGIKVYIYSSGSREAQRLIFGNTSYGDLRKYLCGFFDTNVGNKREPRSYFEISLSVGVDKPSQVLFLTDVYQEAVAAKAAGLEVIISVRPGNVPLPENHGFKTIRSFAEI